MMRTSIPKDEGLASPSYRNLIGLRHRDGGGTSYSGQHWSLLSSLSRVYQSLYNCMLVDLLSVTKSCPRIYRNQLHEPLLFAFSHEESSHFFSQRLH
uniref:Uncharacterized protein n=1 Tax=Perkinsus marinus TaxID=31276 RepID=C9VXM1_9ALVE|nr:unknown protein [Perkinsus marinus]